MARSEVLRGAAEAIRQARSLNPKIHIAARATYLREIEPLLSAGADRVVSGEGEAALTFTKTLLGQLGASEEQIGRERRRVREELFGIGLEKPRPEE